MEEIWTSIAGNDGLYEVSNLGRVKKLKRIVRLGSYGGTREIPEEIMPYSETVYFSCRGGSSGRNIASVVLDSFNGVLCPYRRVKRVNKIKTDNRLKNLYYSDDPIPEDIRCKTGRINCFDMYGQYVTTFKSIEDAAMHKGSSVEWTRKVLDGRIRNHKFIYEYERLGDNYAK